MTAESRVRADGAFIFCGTTGQGRGAYEPIPHLPPTSFASLQISVTWCPLTVLGPWEDAQADVV